MKIAQNIKEVIIASLLLVTLLLPSYIQFSHQLEEEHEYRTCHEQKEHIHEYNVHCDLCNYHFSKVYFQFTSYFEPQVSPIISITTLGETTPLCYYLPLTNTQLRAPPMFS